MRIVQLTSSLPLAPDGSNAPFILHIARSLAERGHEVHLVAPYHPGLRWGERAGNVFFHFFRYAPVDSWCIWGYGRSLRSDVRLKPGVYGLLPSVAVAAALRVAKVQRRGVDLLHAHWLLPNGPIAAAVRRSAVPFVVSLHGSDVYVARKAGLFRRAAAYALRRAQAVVGCSEELTEGARGIAAGPSFHTLPYGVDEERFRPAGSRESHSIRLVAAGRLVEKKGFEYLLRAVSMMAQPVDVTIAGDGDLRQSLRALAGELGLASRVRFAGELAQPEMIELYGSSAIFVLPSVRDQGGNVDGLPNVLLEAMSSGMGVVASRIGGVPQVVADGENGLLVEEKSPQQLARALDLLVNDRQLRLRLGSAARQTILERFTWKRYAQRFEQIAASARETLSSQKESPR